MTREEHLLIILGEECNEVAHRVSKALRFTLSEVQPNQTLTNGERIVQEFNDLFAVMDMIIEEKIINERDALSMFSTKAMKAKKEKVEKYLKHSKSVGK
jgi:hypothetical protein